VVDGDTVEIHGKRIRLFGIDAVESGQRCQRDGKPWLCGRDSALALADKIGERPITCSGNRFDRYRRLVARCSLDGEDLGGWMVENGWAVAFRKYSELYVKREARARGKRVGLWSGEFEMPWEWRSNKKRPQALL
jgi:endonuclease YncB( thermonuclease family)